MSSATFRARGRTARAAAGRGSLTLPDHQPRRRPGPRRGPGPRPGREIRRPVLPGDRRARRPARADRLVRPRPVEQPGHLGRRLRAERPAAARRAIASTPRCGWPSIPGSTTRRRWRWPCGRTCPPWPATCWPSRSRPSRWRTTRVRTRWPWPGARAGPTGSACSWSATWRSEPGAVTTIPREALDELKRHSDPMIGLWATYSLAVLPRGGPDPAPAAELETCRSGFRPDRRAGREAARCPEVERWGAGAKARRGDVLAPPSSSAGRRDLARLGGPRSTPGAASGTMRFGGKHAPPRLISESPHHGYESRHLPAL